MSGGWNHHLGTSFNRICWGIKGKGNKQLVAMAKLPLPLGGGRPFLPATKNNEELTGRVENWKLVMEMLRWLSLFC